MDSALKQRLIGAFVLIALAVIFLPMLLVGSPPDVGVPGSLPIPEPQDRGLERRILPVQPEVSVPGPASEAPALVRVEPDRQPVPELAPPAVEAAEPPLPEPEAEPARPEPVVAAPPLPEVAPAAEGRFLVQFATLSRSANAEALVTRLRGAGFQAYSEVVGEAVRVRAGPYPDRASAERARLVARQLDPSLEPQVLERDAQAATAAAPSTPVAGFAVQLGAFDQEVNANALRDRLRTAGFAAFVDRQAGAASWRVRVGPVLERAEAERQRDRLRTELRLDGFVVSHP